MSLPLPEKHFLPCSLQSTHDRSPKPDLRNDTDTDSCEEDTEQNEEENLSKKWLSKAVALCKRLWPSAKPNTLSVRYLSRGSFNTVFSLSMVISDDTPVDYVLRIPETESTIPRTAAILEYLASFPDLKVPKVITWDATSNNPLENGYVILSRVPGKCLNKVWKDLAHDQKLLLAKELARQLLRIESVTNPIAGTIKVHEAGFRHGDQVNERIFVEAFGANVKEIPADPINWLNSDNGLLPLDRLRHDPPGLSVNEIMSAVFKRRIYQAENHEFPNTYFLSFFRPCQNIIESMIDSNIFEPQSDAICLCHPDLFPRNIMVDFSPDIVISGTLDWDDALFVPRFASRVPPYWLWKTAPEQATEYDYFQREPLDPAEIEADSPENTEIQRVFEDTIGESWVSEATGKWFPLARKLLKFSQETVYYTWITPVNVALWKKRWQSAATNAVENFSMWRQTWKTMFLEESDDSEHEEVPINVNNTKGGFHKYPCNSKSSTAVQNEDDVASITEEPTQEPRDRKSSTRRTVDWFERLLAAPSPIRTQISHDNELWIRDVKNWLES